MLWADPLRLERRAAERSSRLIDLVHTLAEAVERDDGRVHASRSIMASDVLSAAKGVAEVPHGRPTAAGVEGLLSLVKPDLSALRIIALGSAEPGAQRLCTLEKFLGHRPELCLRACRAN